GDVNSTDISLLNGTGLYGTPSYLPAASLGSLGGVGVPVMASVPEPGTWALTLAAFVMTVSRALIQRRTRTWWCRR
ncbi:MAG: PEP-CTERM sorting domain-containing protein, partial [Planctomycetaceae bacterium]